MKTFRSIINSFAFGGLMVTILILSSCQPITEPQPAGQVLLVSPVSTESSCEVCDQETLVAAMVIEQNNLEDQALATAEIVGANAQATLNSVDATLSAAQTRKENDAIIIAANIEATAKFARANAKATLDAAGSTLSAALTQDVIAQTQVQYDQRVSEHLATENAMVMETQSFLIANQNAVKTQSAIETSQWYIDEANQLQEERQRPITFLWTWCLPPFVVLMACLVLWGFWRRLKLQNEDDSSLIPNREGNKSRLRVIKPDYLQVNRWLDAVKKTLLNSEKEDKDDRTN